MNAADPLYMARALELARQGLYSTQPNPRVGCVLVKDGQVVGEGWHVRAGEPHAEVHALRQAGENARGATAYVTLEPCSHFGRTPPCADALVGAGVARVVAAMQDPNPEVAGRGLLRLMQAGIAVQSGVRLELTQQSSEQQLADLAEGRLDLGLLRLPVLRQHPRLHLRALYREPLLLALAADHPLARREAPVALAALAGETFVSIPHLQRGGLSYRAAELCLGAGFYPRPARALSRKTSQLQLIEAGFGVALVPASMRAIAPPAVSFMSLAEAEAYSEVALAWRRDDSPLVEGFVEYFLENLPNEAKD